MTETQILAPKVLSARLVSADASTTSTALALCTDPRTTAQKTPVWICTLPNCYKLLSDIHKLVAHRVKDHDRYEDPKLEITFWNECVTWPEERTKGLEVLKKSRKGQPVSPTVIASNTFTAPNSTLPAVLQVQPSADPPPDIVMQSIGTQSLDIEVPVVTMTESPAPSATVTNKDVDMLPSTSAPSSVLAPAPIPFNIPGLSLLKSTST